MSIVTWSPSDKTSNVTLSNNNLEASGINHRNGVRASLGKSTGKWYWEIKFNSGGLLSIGIANKNATFTSVTQSDTRTYNASGIILPENIKAFESYSVGDTIGVALDMDEGILEYYKNGEYQGVSHTDIKELGEIYPFVVGQGSNSLASSVTANFGATNFEYDIPFLYSSYDSNQNNLPINKTLILSDGEYKKYDEGNPEIPETWKRLIPVMTSGTQDGYRVTASSSYTAAWRAFDRASEEYASGLSNTTCWVSVESPIEINVNRYEITSSVTAAISPENWTLEASHDGIEWSILDTQSDHVWDGVETKSFIINNSEAFSYHRINVSKAVGNGRIGIKEIAYYSLESERISEKLPSWNAIATTLPTQEEFEEEGMEDLSTFDRKITTPLDSPINMTNETLGEDKVFKGTVDLKKYFDLRKIEVK